jgi:hypothetical protein
MKLTCAIALSIYSELSVAKDSFVKSPRSVSQTVVAACSGIGSSSSNRLWGAELSRRRLFSAFQYSFAPAKAVDTRFLDFCRPADACYVQPA